MSGCRIRIHIVFSKKYNLFFFFYCLAYLAFQVSCRQLITKSPKKPKISMKTQLWYDRTVRTKKLLLYWYWPYWGNILYQPLNQFWNSFKMYQIKYQVVLGCTMIFQVFWRALMFRPIQQIFFLKCYLSNWVNVLGLIFRLIKL